MIKTGHAHLSTQLICLFNELFTFYFTLTMKKVRLTFQIAKPDMDV